MSDKVEFSQHKKFSMFRKRANETIARQAKKIEELKKLVYCKHLRVGSMRVEGGYECKCLACGFEWAKQDKPLTDLEKQNGSMFESWQRHNEWREEQGLKPAGCE
ncbi:hypothetical protein GOV10_04420 [Candidatus Woesearchaeota archaeon]|nr:hypothetical protein [Candidatus Woesearchaeota archaeon]